VYIIINKEKKEMTFHEKKTIVTSITGLIITFAYLFYAILKYNEGSAESLTLRFWAITILVFIGIGIVGIIVIMILFHIFYSIGLAIKIKMENKDITDKEVEKIIAQMIKTDTVEDEMGRLIELKSMRIGFIFAGIGFILALFSILLNYSPIIMLNILFLSFSMGSALEGLVQLYYYRKGIRHA
jgi:glucan phosphoethanolaminetransferase (alkaline phosphatase superfamily)